MAGQCMSSIDFIAPIVSTAGPLDGELGTMCIEFVQNKILGPVQVDPIRLAITNFRLG